LIKDRKVRVSSAKKYFPVSRAFFALKEISSELPMGRVNKMSFAISLTY